MAAVLAPSILSADFARLGEEIAEAEAGGAALVHIDVMDGQFVPNITIGPLITAACRRATQLPLDCHLMIVEPHRYVDAFVEAGADMVSVHVEADRHLHRTLTHIRSLGAKAGVAINPSTPLSALDEVIELADYIVVMTVNPGFGGQKLIPAGLSKLRALRDRIDAEGFDTRLEIDGGVTVDNLDEVLASGVDMVVAGSSVFGSADIRATADSMVRRMARAAERERTC